MTSAWNMDIRSVWETSHAVYQYWFLGTSFCVKPVIVLSSEPLTWSKGIIAGIAMTLTEFVLIAACPVWIFALAFVTEVALKGAFGVSNLAVAVWACPALVATLTATTVDLCLLSTAFRQKGNWKRFGLILLSNALCVLVSGYMMVNHSILHPSVA